ncbi:MAG: SEC-C domain-containing protein [bacterium]
MSDPGPYIPLPELEEGAPCVCGSGRAFGDCCEPKLARLNRAMGGLDDWRRLKRYARTFRSYSDLLWEEQFRDEEQGQMAQEYREWDEWASYLWLEGVLLDGFALEGVRSVPEAVREQIARGERLPGGREAVQALLDSFEGLYQIAELPSDPEQGTARLWLPPDEERGIEVPGIFLPTDCEITDLVAGRFAGLGVLHYPTHRPLVIPVLPDGSNFDAAYRYLAPLFPPGTGSDGTAEMMARLYKSRTDLLLRAALEALLPLEDIGESDMEPPRAADGGEIRFMVSDLDAVAAGLDRSPCFTVLGPMQDPEEEEEFTDLLQGGELPPAGEGRRWKLSLDREARRYLRSEEERRVDDLLRTLSRRTQRSAADDPLGRLAESPGALLVLDDGSGSLSARSLHAPALEMVRYLLEREVGPFLARESEQHLTS